MVLIGGGHSHVAVLRAFGLNPMPGTRLTLICNVVHTPYSGMLPGLIAGHYRFHQAHIDLEPLARFAGADFVQDSAAELDLNKKTVRCANGTAIPYDLLSINIGSAPATQVVPGATENAVPVKPISRFLSHWEAMNYRLAQNDRPARIAVVGGGAGGVELLLALQHRLSQSTPKDRLRFHLVTEETELLSSHLPKIRSTFRRIFEARGITLHTKHRVTQVKPNRLRCENGVELDFEEILWVTSAGAAAWPGDAGLTVDRQGFIKVGETLQSISHSDIFAVGDIATMVAHPRPKSGVFAVKQGPALAANLRRHLVGKPLAPHIPQANYLSLISTGDRYAVGSRGRWTMQGRLMWYLKDWIDRRFIATYTDLPN